MGIKLLTKILMHALGNLTPLFLISVMKTICEFLIKVE